MAGAEDGELDKAGMFLVEKGLSWLWLPARGLWRPLRYLYSDQGNLLDI